MWHGRRTHGFAFAPLGRNVHEILRGGDCCRTLFFWPAVFCFSPFFFVLFSSNNCSRFRCFLEGVRAQRRRHARACFFPAPLFLRHMPNALLGCSLSFLLLLCRDVLAAPCSLRWSDDALARVPNAAARGRWRRAHLLRPRAEVQVRECDAHIAADAGCLVTCVGMPLAATTDSTLPPSLLFERPVVILCMY